MPNPITPEMRAALAEVVNDAECGVLSWDDIGMCVITYLPQLRALLDALPATPEESSAVDPRSTQYVCVVGGELELVGQPLAPGKRVTFPTAPANIPMNGIGAMADEIDERTRRIREPIDRAINEVKNGIAEAQEALLLQAFEDGTHPGTVEFKWQVLQRGGIVCWLDMHHARPATPEERAEIEALLRASIRGATESSAR